jgi:hypothetical protein
LQQHSKRVARGFFVPLGDIPGQAILIGHDLHVVAA